MARPYTEKPHPLGYVCCRVNSPPAIDGKVEGPGWIAAPWSEPFTDIEGPSKPAPYYKTQVKMLWDDTALYIGARLEEPQPWANLTLHDDIIYQDNDFEVFIDPDGDNHQYYEFEINALGAWWDLFLVKPYRDGGPALHSFESVAPSEPTQHKGPTGWSPVQRAVWVDGAVNDPKARSTAWGVTLAFPWTLLQQAAHRDCPPKPGDQWRINFSRVQWKVKWDEAAGKYVKDPPDQKEHNWVWSPQWVIAMHQPETWGYLQFSSHTVTESPQNPLALPEPAVAACEAFKPDVTWPLRSFLMDIYYRQKELWDAKGMFADSLEELQLEAPLSLADARLKVQATEVSFIATGQVATDKPGVFHRLYVNEESRVTLKTITIPSEHT